MSARTATIIRALLRRGYSQCKCTMEHPGYLRFRISPNHARRVDHYCARLRRAIRGDIFVCENGQILLGQTRTLCVALAPATVANLMAEGTTITQAKPRQGPSPAGLGRTLTLEELLAP